MQKRSRHCPQQRPLCSIDRDVHTQRLKDEAGVPYGAPASPLVGVVLGCCSLWLCVVSVRWHESFPHLRILAPGRVSARHAIGRVGDEDHGASAQVDAVEEDDVMNLIDDWAERP